MYSTLGHDKHASRTFVIYDRKSTVGQIVILYGTAAQFSHVSAALASEASNGVAPIPCPCGSPCNWRRTNQSRTIPP